MKLSKIKAAAAVTAFSLFFTSGIGLASPALQEGSRGSNVTLLQKTLVHIGYPLKDIDGIYGEETEAAVSEFQRNNHLRVTGKMNNATWRALQKAKPQKGLKIPAFTRKKAAASTSSGHYVPNNKPILAPGKVNSIISTARSYIGTPYQFGGTTPKAFDCSGYLQYVFAQNGISIPRTADEQYKLGLRTKSSRQLVPGYLVFFTTYEPGASHCGIYLGDNEFIHASSSGVRVDQLSNSYWSQRYYGGKHIVQ